MTEQNEQFDENFDLKVSGKLKNDLDSLFKSRLEIPQEVDMAILNKASQKLTHPRRGVRLLRWIGPVAAAAAIILFVSVSYAPKQSANNALSQKKGVLKPIPDNDPIIAVASVRTDFDNNGRVDILDAFKLAKLIQSETSVDKKWDINGDGFVNEDDVDNIALVAVSLN